MQPPRQHLRAVRALQLERLFAGVRDTRPTGSRRDFDDATFDISARTACDGRPPSASNRCPLLALGSRGRRRGSALSKSSQIIEKLLLDNRTVLPPDIR